MEPYSGKITLDLKEWRIVTINLREFLNRMQLNIRDVDSKNYKEMRECEVDTKVQLFAMNIGLTTSVNNLVTTCLQICNKLRVFTCVV